MRVGLPALFLHTTGIATNRVDPDASAYIASLVAASATVTQAQRTAINDFFTLGKTQGWYAQLRRIYLPIWGAAAPNAIDMVTRSSGTFVGGTTPGAGFVQGNGSTGYFDFGVSPQGVGMVPGSSSTFMLVLQAQNTFNAPLQCAPPSNRLNGFNRLSPNTGYTAGRNGAANVADATGTGIFIESEIATNSRYVRRRNSGGAASLGTDTSTPTGAYASYNINSMCGQSTGGARFGFSTAQLGSYGVGLAMTTTQADQFTAALQALWQTCTGLSLP
jgi:hypothetical protein